MVTFLTGAILYGAIFLFGSVGEIVTEKSGHLNLGIPGIMCMGAGGGALGLNIYLTSISGEPSWILVFLFALIFSALFSAFASVIYAFLTVTLRSNQNVTGLALTTFGGGFGLFMVLHFVDSEMLNTKLKTAGDMLKDSIFGFSNKLGEFGDIVFGHGIFVYLALVIAIITAIIFKKSRMGLHLRAVGENPATADAVGINVTRYKYLAIIIGGIIAGFGGLLYPINYGFNNFTSSFLNIQSFGWLAIALVIFAVWKPDLAVIGSFVFGALYYLAKIGLKINTDLLELLPYLVTVIVLIFTSIFGRKSVQPPASLGINYFREER